MMSSMYWGGTTQTHTQLSLYTATFVLLSLRNEMKCHRLNCLRIMVLTGGTGQCLTAQWNFGVIWRAVSICGISGSYLMGGGGGVVGVCVWRHYVNIMEFDSQFANRDSQKHLDRSRSVLRLTRCISNGDKKALLWISSSAQLTIKGKTS